MILRVDEATIDDASILHNLGELYVHDFSEITLTELNAAGRFDHDFWRECWSGERTPYLLRVDDRLAGFTIVARGSRFWRKAIGAYTNGEFDEIVVADERWHGWVQRFVS